VEGVLGQYRIVKKLGEGGMGAVYLAEHTLLGRRAAVKVLQPNLSSNQDIVQRFFNEARAATAIADPGIVQIFDFGYHTDGSAYIVMEFLEGEPLDARLKRHGRLAPEEALRLLRQVASSLHAAHSRGIIHRDLKPENIFLVADREVAGGERAKILDFGIAKLSNNADSKVKTHTAAIMGTPMYMSPEQCRGAGHVDHRSDLYSLGCVLYHLVVGRVPFDGEGIGEIIAAHMMSAPPVPSQQAPGIPPGVDQLILRLLAKRPEERFATAGELAEACGALLGGGTLPPTVGPVAATVMASGTSPGAITGAPSLTTLSGSATAAPVASTVAPAAPKKRGGLIAVGAIAAVGAAIAGVVLLGGGGGGGGGGAGAGTGTAAAVPNGSAAPTPPPTPAVDTAAIAKLVTEARAAADADKWADVTRLAGEALALDPQHADARALADTAKRETQNQAAFAQFTAAVDRKDTVGAVGAYEQIAAASIYKARASAAYDALRLDYVASTRDQAKKLAKAKKCDDLDSLASAAERVFPDAGTAAREIECKGARTHKPGGTTVATPGPGTGSGSGSGSTQPEVKPADTPAKVPGDIDGDGIPDVR
jgi:tRNA A-37 threonylcarbamoyl transferase component Bud32